MNLKNRIFSEKEVNTGRQVEMDIAKVVFVIFVAMVHCTIDGVPEEALNSGLPYIFDTVIGGPMIAPGLMFSMGACLVYGRKKEWNDIVRRGGADLSAWISSEPVPLHDPGSDRICHFWRQGYVSFFYYISDL